MKNRYIFIVSIALLTVAGSSFAAEGGSAVSRFSEATRDSLDEQMKALQAQLNKVREEMRKIARPEEDALRQVKAGRGNLTAEDIPGILSWGQKELAAFKNSEKTIKDRIKMIAGQIRSLKPAALAGAAVSMSKASADEEEYDQVDDALPLDRAGVAAANTASKEISEKARLAKVFHAKTEASKCLQRLEALEEEVSRGSLTEGKRAELSLLRQQKSELERCVKGLDRCEEQLRRSPRIQKRSSGVAFAATGTSVLPSAAGQCEDHQSPSKRTTPKVAFGTDFATSILPNDADEDDQEPDLAAARMVVKAEGTPVRMATRGRRDAALPNQLPTIEGGKMLLPLAGGLVVAQSELDQKDPESKPRRGTGFFPVKK